MEDEIREQILARLLGDESVRAGVSLRAYEIYERRGCAPGRELEDWLQAESEILPPLVEEELQREAASQASFDEAPAKEPATAAEKPVKKTSRPLKGRNPVSDKGAISH
jgi:hypothetical protein